MKFMICLGTLLLSPFLQRSLVISACFCFISQFGHRTIWSMFSSRDMTQHVHFQQPPMYNVAWLHHLGVSERVVHTAYGGLIYTLKYVIIQFIFLLTICWPKCLILYERCLIDIIQAMFNAGRDEV